MTTTFKDEMAGISVHFNGLFVAMIYKMGNNPNIDWKYGLAYNTGRYEKFDSLSAAKDEARKIMAKVDITGKTILY